MPADSLTLLLKILRGRLSADGKPFTHAEWDGNELTLFNGYDPFPASAIKAGLLKTAIQELLGLLKQQPPFILDLVPQQTDE